MKHWECVRKVLWSFLLLSNKIQALSVDNQLVSARNDCFERVAFEAMLPFEKTFRTDDLNSFRVCKERCLQQGDKCQSIAFGVHRHGNGTCQLSEEIYTINGGAVNADNGNRPSGILYDPDFDLYARKTNCFEINDNSITTEDLQNSSGEEGVATTKGVDPTLPVVLTSSRPSQQSSSVLLLKPTPSITLSTDLSSPPTLSTLSGQDHTHHAEENTHLNLPSTIGYDDISSITSLYHEVKPTAVASTTSSSSSSNGGDHFYFTPDMYPLYKHPMLYEPNYPAPNEPVYIPGGYAANAPEVATHYRPPTSYDAPHVPSNRLPKPVFGLGYGTGYGYGPLDSYMPHTDPSVYITYGTTPSTYSASSYLPKNNETNTIPYSTRQTQSYGDRPPPHITTSNGDFMNFPTRSNTYTEVSSSPTGPSYATHGFFTNGSNVRHKDSINWDKRIHTYFNPDDYLNGSKKKHPSILEDDVFLNYHRHPLMACFRRVLAGKRVSPHWVRRTIACERIEECMRECGREKRFTCEGFNYRLDPSGHGQGDCELIEIPLAQIDLYSSTNRRDSNLLRHPDYDYYERDRNAPPSCRTNLCKECKTPGSAYSPQGGSYNGYGRPQAAAGLGWSTKPYKHEHFAEPLLPSSSGGGGNIGIAESGYYLGKPLSSSIEHYQHPGSGSEPSGPIIPPSSQSYESSHTGSGSYEISSHGSTYYDPSSSSFSSSGSGGEPHLDPIDRFDITHSRPHYIPQHSRWQTIPSSGGYDASKYGSHPFIPSYSPGNSNTPHRPLTHDPGSAILLHTRPNKYLDPYPSTSVPHKKAGTHQFVPHSISADGGWGSYGGNYGWGPNSNKQTAYWGLGGNQQQQHSHSHRRKNPTDFNYFDLGLPPRRSDHAHESNSIANYPGSSYDKYDGYRDHYDYKHQWTRRPGPDECSAKTSEGFRLRKKVIKNVYSVPTLTECERLCSGQDAFVCHTYSYRYAPSSRDNCLLCDRPINRLDYYVDIEPDRDYDIYSMADDIKACLQTTHTDTTGASGISSSHALSDPRNAQCFFRAIDATRFYKSIVRDSLTVRSVGECEVECIKSIKFTCRAFAFRYGHQKHASVIDNCQLSDWPVRDMDKERHLIADTAFDIYERASYGHGCEIQAIVDRKHNKKSVCYLGYGSPAKLLTPAIKKVITVSRETECKKECIRFRDTTPFKCYSFSYGSRKSTFNCEMSDLDQTELKLNIHYTHTEDRDFWLFAWNPFDYTCRDKVTTVGGPRVQNNRRMDIFRASGDLAWRHYTVGGKGCRRSSPCEKNLITGFYSCEFEGGEIGSWDYCCKIDHPCGYSQDFAYPWCFVGDESDQWRKCSDHYYPGNRTNSSHAGYTIKSYRPYSEKRRYGEDSHTSGAHTDQEYQKSSRPGHLQNLSDFTAARLWPVTYLYSEGPPNSTDFSNFVDCNKETC